MLANKNLYNDKELFDDADLDWYDYGFRNYDEQIGRFPQLDPLTWDYPELTNYQYASNEPIANVDIDGLEGGSALSAIPTGAMAAEKTLAPVVIKATLKTAKSAGSSFFSVAGRFLSKAGSSLVGGVKGFINEMNRRAKINIAKDIEWIKSTTKQLEANRKANWASGNTIIQQLPKDFMENPLEFLEGGAELDVLKGLGLEMKVLNETKFTKRNFRKNLIKSTEINPGKATHAHHVFPQKFIKEFEKRGINVHDPSYGTWWEAMEHLSNAKNYNVRWQQFLNTNPSKQEILDFGKKLMSEYGIRTLF